MTAWLQVESPGLFTTVQDLGRYGFAHLGVSASGAADSLALRAGNLLVGNAEDEAALEMTHTSARVSFSRDAVVAFAGGPPARWAPVRVREGEAVAAPQPWTGARCYLCVRGGIELPRVLGSRSTHAGSGIGGLQGRAVRRGDRVPLADRAVRDPFWQGFHWPLAPRTVLRVTPGPQADWFGADALDEAWTVGVDSDRMGLRLRGPRVEPLRSSQLLTEGASLGAIQVPGGGDPIILFVDHQTTGGYPKIANVITADLWRVGELRPGGTVRFEPTTIDRALEVLRLQEHMLDCLR